MPIPPGAESWDVAVAVIGSVVPIPTAETTLA